MCGIHGFINGDKKVELNSDDFIKQGFIANMLRGTDSSGIAIVDAEGYANHQKLPVPGVYLPQDKLANKLIAAARSKNTAAMCHVRAATVGGVSYANAHPFVLDDSDGNTIVGVHNGTLQGWATKENAKCYTVDSEWAMSHILTKGKAAFEDFTGAFAMVWWLSEAPGTLRMARNKERPMYVAWTEDGNMLYASEAGMLHWLCERNNIKLVGSIKFLEENKQYEFDISDPTKYEKSDLPAAKPAYTGNYYGAGDDTDWYGQGSKSTYRSVYNHESIMDKLTRIFEDSRKEENPTAVQPLLLPSPDTAQRAGKASADELADAMTMGMLGVVGTFLPYGADDKTGSLYGQFECKEYKGELNAVMRDCDDVDWQSLEEFKVTVLGIKDDGNDFIAIVSKPIREAATV